MQDRKNYASGNTLTTEGFRCSIGEPIDIKVTVGESEDVDIVSETGKIIPDGDYFITLEVNGEKAAYRDLHRLGEDTVTIGDYTISDDLYLYGVSEDDEVVMRLEPVELIVTDAFRAAVSKVAPKSEGGSGGGVSVVTLTFDDKEELFVSDKTYAEIIAAMDSNCVRITVKDSGCYCGLVIGSDDEQGYDVYVATVGLNNSVALMTLTAVNKNAPVAGTFN